MTMSKRLRLAVTLAPVLGALTFAMPAQAATSGTSGTSSGQHFQSGTRGDFRGGVRDHNRHHFGGFGFGFGFWDPWWAWDPVQYWAYPYPYYSPYYYPPYPAYYAPPPGPPPQAPVQATGAPPPQSWYYCDNPQGYYPYVRDCSSAWRQVTPPRQSGNTITPQPKQ
jgi:hypothetical protein